MELNKISLKQVLTFIQESVHQHAQEMKANNDVLEEIMSTMPPSNARSLRLREIYAKNNEISKRNHELNSLHISILSMLRNNKDEFTEYINVGTHIKQEVLGKNKIDRLNEELLRSKKQTEQATETVVRSMQAMPTTMDEAFELTINNKIELDSFHPYASNNDFLNKLIRYYESKEQYEKCAQIAKIRASVKN